MVMPTQDYYIRETAFNSLTANLRVAAEDATRVAIVFSAINTSVLVSTKTGTGSNGLLITTTIPTFLIWSEVGALVSQPWYVGAAVAGSMTVFECFYRPALSSPVLPVQTTGSVASRLRSMLSACTGGRKNKVPNAQSGSILSGS